MPAATWALTEVGAAALGDPRRTRRVASVLTALAARPGEGLPAACATAAATTGASRCLDNGAIAAAAVLRSHIAATTARVQAEDAILAVQDPTALDFTAHPAVAGAGPLAHPARHGLGRHSVLAVSEAGAPLGLRDQHLWARDPATVGQRATRRPRPPAEKASQRWLDAQVATQHAVPAGVAVLTVADRAADIFALFALPRPAGYDLLIRAAQDRCVAEEAHSRWDVVAATPVGAVVPVAVGRRADRAPREARLTLRWTALTLLPPRNRPDRAQLAPLPVAAILAEEPVPPGQRPIRWLVLPTRPVATGAEALHYLRCSTQRWLVERYHCVLKAGCRVEAWQRRTTERLARALARYAIVAWRLLWVTYLARAAPAHPCPVALTAAEWPVLYRAMHHGAARPAHPPPLGQAVRWIARLGGLLDRAGDGPPGVKVVWRGLRRLEDLTLGWHLAVSCPAALPLLGNE